MGQFTPDKVKNRTAVSLRLRDDKIMIWTE
jgi:hypothetical protein